MGFSVRSFVQMNGFAICALHYDGNALLVAKAMANARASGNGKAALAVYSELVEWVGGVNRYQLLTKVYTLLAKKT